MSIVNRRNAVIGYLALRALKRSRRNAAFGYLASQSLEATRARRRNRRALKVTLYVLLGIVSLGVLAAVAGIAGKRKLGAAPLAEPEADASPADELVETPAETESVPAT